MPLKLKVEEIESDRIKGHRAYVAATGYGPHGDKPMAITPECVTLDQLEREISRLQQELKAVLEEAKATYLVPEEDSPRLHDFSRIQPAPSTGKFE